jgi:RNA polymerase sigma-32 factor
MGVGVTEMKKSATKTKTSRKASPAPADMMDIYMKQARTKNVLTREEEADLVAEAAAGNEKARGDLVSANLRFVVKIAHEYRGYKIPIGDLVQEGNIGLLQAVKKYDPGKGCRLISYAVFWIRSAIQEYIMRNWSMVKIGTTAAERRLFYRVKTLSGQDNLGVDEKYERFEELAEKVGASTSDVVTLSQRVSRRDSSLDLPVRHDSTMTRAMFISDEAPGVESLLASKQIQTKAESLVSHAAAQLNDREKEILKSRLLGEDKAPLRELAEKFQISKERVRQIETRIKEKIAHFVESQGAAGQFREQY